jgi:hypothetical protein
MLSTNLIVDECLSSTALCCIQTAERISTGESEYQLLFFSIGMDRIDQFPIRIEPGLFGCPHLNHKIVDSFMTNKKLVENCYKIKLQYKSLI